MKGPPPRFHSPEGDKAIADTIAEFEQRRVADLPPEEREGMKSALRARDEYLEEIPREVAEEVRKYRVITREALTRGWRGRFHLWLGIPALLTQFANKTNELFETEVKERRRMETHIDELTELCSFLAKEVASLRQRG